MVAIEFNHVWKKFKRGEKFDSLRDLVPNLLKRFTSKKSEKSVLSDKEFWAVKDVDFQVKKGEVVGIIGPNGAGKSTILKMLSGILVPNQGTKKINGRLSALIEITAGFHPELTGRENVYLNGTILGMKRKEINARFDQIVEFSGIKEFIDTPVKRYSSGMYSRLGFSVAAHVNPDVLLVDEVLAVGDIAFQSKCAEKMRELLASGVTIVIVSHNLALIRNLCKRAILINKGEAVKEGSPEEVIPYYENIVFSERERDLTKKLNELEGRVKLNEQDPVTIKNVQLLNGDLTEKKSFQAGDHIKVRVEYKTTEKIESPIFQIKIMRADGVLCCSSDTKTSGVTIKEIEGKGAMTVDLGKINLAPGLYVPHLAILDKDMVHPYALRHQDLLRIEMGRNRAGRNAVFIPEIGWDMEYTPTLKGVNK